MRLLCHLTPSIYTEVSAAALTSPPAPCTPGWGVPCFRLALGKAERCLPALRAAESLPCALCCEVGPEPILLASWLWPPPPARGWVPRPDLHPQAPALSPTGGSPPDSLWFPETRALCTRSFRPHPPSPAASSELGRSRRRRPLCLPGARPRGGKWAGEGVTGLRWPMAARSRREEAAAASRVAVPPLRPPREPACPGGVLPTPHPPPSRAPQRTPQPPLWPRSAPRGSASQLRSCWVCLGLYVRRLCGSPATPGHPLDPASVSPLPSFQTRPCGAGSCST